ncbi:hypothetical protein PYCCODRAFT_540140 [Trametes coccinea BRFM310]|uniref:Uncharacterized protein n=1 Tax=Trametes coccinea (strain BRFM310) TaxID=1353009 RepID=A0A1Y2IL28_TRAC3|nr:hypothetical protein PYCCODRAFT_540140 [Trametes coccinea BRFM310]
MSPTPRQMSSHGQLVRRIWHADTSLGNRNEHGISWMLSCGYVLLACGMPSVRAYCCIQIGPPSDLMRDYWSKTPRSESSSI